MREMERKEASQGGMQGRGGGKEASQERWVRDLESLDPMKPAQMGKTIALDFDGVLHSFTSGWKGPGCIPDPPVPGMAAACQELAWAGFELVVISTRALWVEGARAIYDWLQANGFPLMEITDKKVPYAVMFDDRCERFNGSAEEFLAKVYGWRGPWMNELQDKKSELGGK